MKIDAGESQNIEYKESWRDEYLKWVCGFANAKGGKIYIGVNDDREVVGVKGSKQLMEDIPNKIATLLGLVCDVNLLYADSLEYIEIVVEPSNIPIAYKGTYHYRSGSTKQEMRGTALQQFILKKMGRSWDDIPNDRATLDDIDRTAIEYFLRKGIEAQRIPEDDRNASTEQVLTTLGMIDDEGILKNAAVLLFGKKPTKFFPSATFNIGRFGKDEADLMFQDVIEGNVIQMVDRVMEALQGKYLVSPVRFEGMQRYETLEIPKEALREILYNAVTHKDYAGAHIQMHVYADHLEVWNEGELPIGYTQEILMGDHSSKPRNRNIANAMFMAGFIDRWGRGYKKIRDGFKAAAMPMPEVENFCGGVRVRIERTIFMNTQNRGINVPQNVSQTEGNVPQNVPHTENNVPKNAEDRKRKVLSIIANEPTISTNKLGKRLGVSYKTIRRDIDTLRDEYFIQWVGSAKSGRWEIRRKENI